MQIININYYYYVNECLKNSCIYYNCAFII